MTLTSAQPTFQKNHHQQAQFLQTLDQRHDVAVIVKTGATELFDKAILQLSTILQPIESLLLFSEVEQDLGQHHVRDVLASMPISSMNNTDFDFYRLVQTYRLESQNIASLNAMPDARESHQTAGHNAAWALDKYKFLPMIEQTWTLEPFHSWYVFIEADTYLCWSNLLSWLANYNPDDAIYLGKATPMHEEGPGFYFGHGGSGFIMSRAAMLAFHSADLVRRWDFRVPDLWFGDFIVAKVLADELGLFISDASPMLSGDSVTSIPWTRVWCQKMITLHHIRPDQMQALWSFEQRRDRNSTDPPPLLYKELFDRFGAHLTWPTLKHEWDNFANADSALLDHPVHDEFNANANNSPGTCSEACSSLPDCMQWSYLNFTVVQEVQERQGESVSNGICYLSSTFRIGEISKPSSWVDDQGVRNIHVRSCGWSAERIGSWLLRETCA
ncbi:hypothetical protein D6C78_11022 [Aureobasidium pullulans]|uniref:N-acetylgalactosaminide beta-1,3-galactosyltransferase n=1 Tax=Aureobasidium pullulans TaxID=5580 RepID=A0A4T0B846_AURPU|nr:hypothetical protein D6C78_11022 [Aureobasidium pullulans]